MIVSVVFTNYIEHLVYQNKVEELTSYGENILEDLKVSPRNQEQIANQYSRVLQGRDIYYSVLDPNLRISYGRLAMPLLTEAELRLLVQGETVVVKRDLNRFDQAVTFVGVPYVTGETLNGVVLLISPISGTREMISQINQYLLYTVFITFAVSVLLSWFLSKIHVNRIQRIRDATSMISSGNYNVSVPSTNFDEIGELANDFNHMAQKLKVSKDEIESLENRRRNFFADVSHELRTPLTTISGVIEGIKEDMIPENEKNRSIQLVSQETKRLIRLVNENLDYEKIRSNQVKLTIEEIQLIELFEIIKEQLILQAEKKQNDIIIEVDEKLTVYADYDRLIQIIINITKNSIQFTSDGIIWLRGRAGDRETIIEIEDTGIGIAPEEIKSIWNRFYKADISRKNNPYGESGLGLSIVKQLVQLHHGTIDVESVKGEGTRFEIRLPIRS